MIIKNSDSNLTERYRKRSFSLKKSITSISLTNREIEILRNLVLGYTFKKIASVLNISPRTVESYIEILKLKMNCNTKNDLIEKAIIHKIIRFLEF